MIELYKGRNNRNVGIDRSGTITGFGGYICQISPPFTVYVPGLAGVPHNEEQKNEGLIYRKVAGGEANLVLRNVLYLLCSKGLEDKLNKLVSGVFPNLRIRVNFRPARDTHIAVEVSTNGGVNFHPLDMVGTGVLQAIQIFAYSTLFTPKILLLDEPDAHLHPSNQNLLLKSLEVLTEETDTKVILATHSRHLINSAPDGAKMFWLERGKLRDSGDIDTAKILLELGALDNADKVLASQKPYLILIEDERMEAFESLLSCIGESLDDFDIVPYFGVTHSDAAAKIMTYLRPSIGPERTVIVHRDRDFMTDDEIADWRERIVELGFIPFITNGSDVESYFINRDHLASLANCAPTQVDELLQDILIENDDKLKTRFRDKRREINKRFYADGGGPVTTTLCPPDSLIAIKNCVGKDLLKRIRSQSARSLGKEITGLGDSGVCIATDLRDILAETRQRET